MYKEPGGIFYSKGYKTCSDFSQNDEARIHNKKTNDSINRLVCGPSGSQGMVFMPVGS